MSLLNKIKKAGTGETFLKVLLAGESGSGKTSSIVYGCPKPALLFDLEDGSDQYGKAADFDLFPSDDPFEILSVTQELLQLQAKGQELPYKSIVIDSGTVLYNNIKKYYVKKIGQSEGDPDKFKLEFNEFDAPKSLFYEIIGNLKKLKINFFMTAHAKDNYLKGELMKIDPNSPLAPDIEKRAVYEMDVFIILKKVGKRHKAEVKKSRLIDKEGNPLLPAVIDNFDNQELVKMLHEMANKDKGFETEKPAIQQNVIKTDGALSAMVDEIIEIVQALQMSNEVAITNLKQATNEQVDNPHNLNKEQAQAALEHFRRIREKGGAVGEQ